MRKTMVIAAGLLALAGCSIGKDVPLAEQQVTNFHKQLDGTQFEAIWQDSAQDLKNSGREASFMVFLDAVHRKLGAFRSGKQQGWNDQASTNGHFITLNYLSIFAKGTATENFVYRIQDGKALLAGYHLSSDALILN